MVGGKKEPIVVAQIMGKMNGGGVEAVIMNYYRHIDRTKVQFDFICDEDSTNIPYEEIEKLGGHVILCPPYQDLSRYMKYLEKLFGEKKYNIVHSNINTLSVFPLRAAKKAGVPVRIAHSHNTSSLRELKRNIAKDVLRRHSRRYATALFACSETAGQYQFGKKALRTGKISIINNALDIEAFRYDRNARMVLRREIGLKENDFVIGHIGRFVAQKNHLFLIDVFMDVKKTIKNAKLVLVGQGPLLEKVKKKVSELKIDNDVIFLGQRNDADKLNSIFDAFCLPSIYEGLGLVAIEAQIAGVPSVVSVNVPREAIISENVIRSKLNVKEFSNSIISMSKMNERKDIISDEYDIRLQALKLQNKYLENI